MSLILHIIFYFFKWLDQIYPVCGHSRFRILVFYVHSNLCKKRESGLYKIQGPWYKF